jgi:CheY-like chemotaxis protein
MKKILVVDDEIDLRKVIVSVLNGKGYETIEAGNGADAFELTMIDVPDLIISDVVMDRVNGFLFHELLQANEKTAAIPLILITGLAFREDAWKSHPEVVYLTKPFNMSVLLEAVEKKLKPN